MRNVAAAILCALGLACLAQDASAGIDAVWANDGGDKVTQDELRASNSTPVVNSVWDGTTVNLFGARNEVVNFNLVLEAPASASTNVNVSISNLTGPGGAVLRYAPRATNNLFNWTSTEIEIFRVGYLQITGSSGFGGALAVWQEPTYPARSQCPGGSSGTVSCAWTDRPIANKFVPDIAVPIEASPNFGIAAGNNQSIWIDIYIPKTATPGIYTGTVTISEDGASTKTVPVSLTVRNFALPDTPSSRTMLFGSIGDISPRYGEGSAASQAMANEMSVAHRHKISMIDGNWDTNWDGDAPAVQWLPYLDGSAFTSANGYAGPGAGVGNGVFSIGTYGGMTRGSSQAAFTAHFNNWESWFQANSPLTERFVYLCDEGDCQASTPNLSTQLSWWSAIQGPGSSIPTMATQPLLSAASTTLSRPTSVDSQGDPSANQAAADSVTANPSRKLFAYNGGRPGSGSFATEDAGVALRELPWSQYKKSIDRWFFWEATYYNNYQGGQGHTNVFTTAQTWGPAPVQDSNYGLVNSSNNGDGVLFYPGTDQLFPSYSYGINGPLASLRLKHWRRGIQDVDYLALASKIDPTAVQNLVNQMVPKALWENQCHALDDCTYFYGPVTWSENPADWEAARSTLAGIIESANPASTTISLASTPNPSATDNSVTFTATVSASSGTPTGSVTFWPLGTGTLSNGTATFSTASLPVGTHSVTAVYDGDGSFATSTSAPLTQTVYPGTMQVSATTGLVAAGNQGGPFSLSAFQFQLSTDAGNIPYSISGVPNWLTASATSGTATPTPTTIDFTVNSSANSLPAGNHIANITFTNSANGLGTQTQTIALAINQSSQGGGGVGGSGSGGQKAGIWATGPLAKVLQTNAVLGGAQSLQISASRNEFADFQVHVVPTTSAIQMNVAVSDFTHTQTGYAISGASNVVLYREAYLNITNLSDQNGVAGLTPDVLIPTVDPYSGEARNAFPVAVQPSRTQSAWIDVLVPPGAPPGNYTGTVTISDGSTVIGQVAVTLKVWAFTLPSTSSLKSAFGIGNGLCFQAYGRGSDNGYVECAQYPASGGNPDRAIELTARNGAKLALDHRISLMTGLGPPGGDWNHYDSTYGDLIGGTAATLLAGAAQTSALYLPPGGSQTDPGVIQDWVAHFTAKGWLGTLFDFSCNGCLPSQALAREQAMHAGSPDMKTLVPVNMANATQNNLLPDLNIIVPLVNDMEPQGGSNQRSSYDSFLSGTNKFLWWTQTCQSHGNCSNGVIGAATSTWPSYMIDARPVRNRVFQWLAFIDNVQGEFYDQIDFCSVSACGPNGDSNDPWVSVYRSGGNGDGTLVYPGTPAKIGGTTPVPLPSIRLKLLRDGMQDFEYLSALSRSGQDAFARSTAAAFITNAYTFNNDPQAMLAAREALGDRLSQLVGTTTLTSSASTSTYGQSVTFTATVAPNAGTPTGSVTFLDGATQLGTVTLSNGTATFTTSSLSAGSHSITAAYGGDGTFAASTSAALTQIVNQASTTTSISSSVNPSSFGQATTLTATVTGTGATGTVTFLDGATTLGSGTLAGGTATLSIGALSAGSHSITALYGGDGNFANSTSSALTQVVNQASAATSIGSSVNPSSFGQSVTFTATVAGTGATGTVTFRDGATSLGTGALNGSGQATLSTGALGVGSHSITAVYGGDGNFASSTSSALTQVVNQLATTTSLGSSLNPANYGQSVTFTATVAGTGATGTVTFRDGAATLGSGTLSGGTATFSTSALGAGSHSITAVYGGDTSFASSTSSALTQVVNQASTTTSVGSSPNPSSSGQSVTFTATVTGTGATGTVTFRDGATALGSGTLSSGTATFSTSSLSVASHSITAVYGGDTNYKTSTSSALTQLVNQPAPTVTGVSPGSGLTAGGASVTVTGTNLTGASAVSFGGAAATAFTVVNATSITATTPAHAAGLVNVAVTTPGGTGTGNALYSYVASPKAVLTAPAPGTTLSGASATFQWTTGVGVTQYWLSIGNAAGGSDLYNVSQGSNLSGAVSNLPTDGRTLFVRLWSLIAGAWQFNDYTYTAATLVPQKSVLTTPAPGTTLSAASVTFQWTAGTGVSQYWLSIGNAAGGSDLYNVSQGSALSGTVSGLPTDGRTLFVRLWSLISGAWQFNDYTYTAVTTASPKAVLTTPAPGTTLSAASVTFQWTAGTGVSQYWLSIGNATGGSDLYNVSQGSNLSGTVSSLPTDGRTLFVRLWSLISGTWQFNDYTYTAVMMASQKAVLTAPTPGGTLAGASATFQWTTGIGVSQYWLSIGNAAGGSDLYNVSQGSALSGTVSGLPTDGRTLFVRLWSQIAGAWVFNDYTYTAATIVPQKSVLTAPTPGGTLSGASVTFQWSTGTGVGQYWLSIGNAAGGSTLYNLSQGTNLSVTVSNLPTDGRTLFVRLWSQIAGAWQFNDYTYTAATLVPQKSVLTAPAPGTALSAASVTFQWTAGVGVSQYWLSIGDSAGGSNLYNQSQGSNLSGTVSGLPTDGRTLFVRLWSLISGAWQFNDYTYTASSDGGLKAAMTTPAPGTTLPGASVSFAWRAGVAVSQYWLAIGSTAGGHDLYNQSQGAGLFTTVDGLPTDGRTIFVRLLSLISGAWQFADYTYSASTASCTSPDVGMCSLRFMIAPLACGDSACAFRYLDGAYTPGIINSLLDHSMQQNCNGRWAYGTQGDRCPDGSAFPAADGIIVGFNGERVSGATKNSDGACVGGTVNLRPTASSNPMTNASDCGAGYTSYDEHPGYDYRASMLTPVRAAAKGVVVSNGGQMCVRNGIANCADFGFIGIDHGNGYISQYGHLDPLGIAVSPGQIIAEGAPIGLSGEKGVEGNPHLHFEVLKLIPGRPNDYDMSNYAIVDPYGWTKGGPLTEDPLFGIWGIQPQPLWK